MKSRIDPLRWFSPQNNEHLRAHCYIGHNSGGYTAYGIRPHSDGTWSIYGSFYNQSKTFGTVDECKSFIEELRNRYDYNYWMNWDKPAPMMYQAYSEDCMYDIF